MPPQETNLYTWRCAKCFYHFANIAKVEGMLREEKKCPKCKSLNILTLSNKEIIIHCKLYDPTTNGYREESSQMYSFENDDY